MLNETEIFLHNQFPPFNPKSIHELSNLWDGGEQKGRLWWATLADLGAEQAFLRAETSQSTHLAPLGEFTLFSLLGFAN